MQYSLTVSMTLIFLTCTNAVGCLREKLNKLLYSVMKVKNALITPVFCVHGKILQSFFFILFTPNLNWSTINCGVEIGRSVM